MPAKDANERGREAQRAPVPVDVHYRFSAREEFTVRRAVDLSATGVFLPYDGEKRVGAMVELRLISPDGGRTLQGFGRVARLGRCPDDSPGMGVQFVSFAEQDLELLEELVAVAVEASEKSKVSEPS